MEIKTITYALHCNTEFDAEVNKALSEGWILSKREPLIDILYAELVKVPPVEKPRDITPVEAVQLIKDTCALQSNETCDNGSCPLHSWCLSGVNCIETPPHAWVIPEGEEI